MKKHPHAAALKRIGTERVRSHFDMSRGAYYQWTVRGVPPIHHNTIRLLASLGGVQVPEFNKEPGE